MATSRLSRCSSCASSLARLSIWWVRYNWYNWYIWYLWYRGRVIDAMLEMIHLIPLIQMTRHWRDCWYDTDWYTRPTTIHCRPFSSSRIILASLDNAIVIYLLRYWWATTSLSRYALYYHRFPWKYPKRALIRKKLYVTKMLQNLWFV